MLTTIDNKKLQLIIQLSGKAIRDFLSQADASKFRGEAHIAINAFHQNPSNYTDEKLLAYGTDMFEAINHPVRIEIRGANNNGASQMVAKGIWGHKRQEAMLEIANHCEKLGLGIHLKLAGTSSMEFNVDGVDKSLPIRFLQSSFDEVLNEMKYLPGPRIDCRRTRLIIAADGDGTIYDGPRVGQLPTLAESPVKEPLCSYLLAGGVFMLVSGNDINRTFNRLMAALPKEVYCRVLIAANGGAELIYVNSLGGAKPIKEYKKKALDFLQGKTPHNHALNIIYIGDDGATQGNDYPAFCAVGFKHSVLVAKQFLPEFDPGLKSGYMGGLLQGTKKYIENFMSQIK